MHITYAHAARELIALWRREGSYRLSSARYLCDLFAREPPLCREVKRTNKLAHNANPLEPVVFCVWLLVIGCFLIFFDIHAKQSAVRSSGKTRQGSV
jgi:hypothetical protein